MAEKTKKAPAFNITIPIYEGVDLMDVAAPYEMFNWMGTYWMERAVTVRLAAAKTKPVKTRDKLKLTPDISFGDCDKEKLHTHLLWVPGGGLDNLREMMKNTVYLDFIKKQSEKAVYVTSVCEGAMLLCRTKSYKRIIRFVCPLSICTASRSLA